MPAAKTDLEIAYLAGLLDADGCVMVYKTRDKYYVRLVLSQANLYDINKIRDIWGGNLVRSTNNVYQLVWNGFSSLEILKLIRKFSIFKKEQIEFAIYFLEKLSPGAGNDLDSQKRFERENIYNKLRLIKKKKYAKEF